ncbi:MAG: hypothetical protein ABIP29_04620 [Candidatus Eisenbacteria bacterium]
MTIRMALARTPTLVLWTLCLPLTAGAQPDPRTVTADPVVVANASGTPIGASPAGYDVVVRDPYPTPAPGRVVTLDFFDARVRLHAVQNAGTTLDCAARAISRVTDAAGAVNFAVRGGGFDNTDRIDVILDGVVFARVKGRSTDLDGIDGTTGLYDFALFGANFLNNAAAHETDFDVTGTTNLGDFAIFGAEFLGGATGAYCP